MAWNAIVKDLMSDNLKIAERLAQGLVRLARIAIELKETRDIIYLNDEMNHIIMKILQRAYPDIANKAFTILGQEQKMESQQPSATQELQSLFKEGSA